MANRYIPLFLKHAPKARVRDFAVLAGLEATTRSLLLIVAPLTVYDALQDSEQFSAIYFAVGIVSLIWGLMVPWGTRFIPRRWMYSLGCCLYVIGHALGGSGIAALVPLCALFLAMATATTFVCLNAYVLDYIERQNLGRVQSMQMFFAAIPWCTGPLTGVWLREVWQPLPFIVAATGAVVLLATFWILRLGNGKQIARAKGPAANPLAYLARFATQPRLLAGWTFAVIRSCGWWTYILYLPVFCIENGLGDKLGATAVSISNSLLFGAPIVFALSRKMGVRRSLRIAFASGGGLWALAAAFSGVPVMTVAAVMLASILLVVLDVIGGLPFMMAVRPSERTEMSAVYSSFRDVSGILTPGFAWLVLQVAPLPGVFAVMAVLMGACFLIAGALHPRLGVVRPSRGGAIADA